MPTYEIKAPDGKMIEVNAPEGATPDQVLAYVKSNYSQSTPEKLSIPKAAWQGVKQGSTLGFGDEIQAGIAAGTVGLANLAGMTDLTAKEAYGQALEDFRGDLTKAREDRPIVTGVGEVGGAIATGLAGGGQLSALAKAAPVRTAIGAGGVSGGLYGFGSGEGGAEERLKDAGTGASLGAVTGGVAVPVSRAAGRGIDVIASKIGKPLGNQGVLASGEEKAIDKVVKRLKKDFPDEAQFKAALEEWADTDDLALAEVAGKQTQRLARGAAQFPSGDEIAGKYVYEKRIPTVREHMKNVISDTVSPSQNIFDTIDDVVTKGRVKAAPLYDKAFSENTSVVDSGLDTILERPAVRKALKNSVQIMRNEGRYLGAPDKELKAITRDLAAVGKMDEVEGPIARGLSLRTLDHTKRALDEQIGKELRAGGTASDLIQAKNDLVGILDKVDKTGAYSKARAQAGDYLTHKKAIEEGRQFMKADVLLLERKMKGMSRAERESFKVGVAQKLRDIVDDTNDRANLYNAVIGKNETMRNKLRSIMSPEEYKSMLDGLRGTERLYKFKDSLGNSITAAKQIDASEFTPQELDFIDTISNRLAFGYQAAALSLFRDTIKRVNANLSDKMAGQVSEILFETDPTKKLKLLKQLRGSGKAMTTKQKEALQTYYALENSFKEINAAKIGATSGIMSSQTQSKE